MKKKGIKMGARVIRIEIPIETQDKTDPALGKITARLENLDSAAKKTQRSIDDVSKKVSGFEKSLGTGLDGATKKASGFEKSLSFMKERWQILLEAKDKITPTVKQAIAYVKSLAGKAWKVTLKAVDLVTSPVKRVFGLLQSPLIAAGVTISAGAGIADTVQTFAEFETAMSQVKAISGATGENFDKLTEKAKQMGATTKFTATEAAEGFNYMAMAGWNTNDMLNGIDGIMSLAAASGENLGTTSDIVTDALTAFGLKASDSGHFADVMAQAAASANTNVGLMGETFKYVGTMAGSLGYNIEDVSLAVGLMANAGLKGSMAGTSLNTMFTRLSTNTSGATDAIRELGVEFFNSDGTARKLSDVMKELRTATAGMSAEQKSNLANTVAGMEAQKGLLAILNASEEDYNHLSEAINNADGASKRMADTMLDNLSGKWTLFKSALDGVKIALAERMEPYLMNGLEWLTNHMPDVENALISGGKRIEQFVSNTKKKISGIMDTAEWENADFFGKVKIAWDEIIANPFSEWWNGSGKVKMAGIAKDVGLGLGTGISAGILTLLGIDITSTIDEGASIGKQFAAGFAEGFQGLDILGALGGKLTGALSNASKLIPGGAAPDLSSWLSAAMLAKIGIPLFKMGSGAMKLGKSIYGAIGSTGNAMVGGSGILGTLANVGYGLTGGGTSAGMYFGNMAGTMSGGMAALVGAGSIAGGVIGAGTLFSAGKNIYTAVKTDDNDERAANISSAGLKVTGVGTGAALGAMIGSVVPVLGTGVGALIGAGVGGLAGMFAGGKVEENYEKQAEAAEMLKQKSEYALESATFGTKELAEAFKDTNVSAAEFGNMMQEATSQKIRDSFGDIKLSVQEIEDAAKRIVLGNNEQSINQFADAAGRAEHSFANLQSSVTSLDRLNWKASLGNMDSTDVEEYIAGIDGLITNATAYLDDKHYEAKAAIDLLVEPGNETDMFTGLNTMYADMQAKIESLGGELKAKVNVALEDGVITLDEQAEITNLQSQITDITNQIAAAETEASFQSLQIKYSGASLDADSFASLISEVQAKVQETAESYDEAIQISLTNLNLQLQNGAITQEQFDAQLQALTEGYQGKITDLAVRVESFELQSIQDAFGSELDGILPNLEGTVAERLGQAMHNAMAQGVDVSSWASSGEGLASAVEWLGLDGLEASTQSAIAGLMGQVASSLPEQLTTALSGTNIDMGDSVNNMLTSSIESADLSGTGEVIAGKLGDSLGTIDMSESGAGLQEGLQSSLAASIEGVDLSGVAESLNTKLVTELSAAEGVDLGGFAASLQTNISSSVEGLDYSSVTSAVGSGISSAVLATIGEIQGAVSSLYSQVGSFINSTFAAGYTTRTTVTITVDYKLANPSATINFSGGGTGSATVSASIGSHAAGGYVGNKQLSWLAEEGYGEFVIPTNPSRRGRALELYEQAGRMLGVGAHADGGFVGNPVYGAYNAYTASNHGGIENIHEAIIKAASGNYEFSEDDLEEVSSVKPVPVKTSGEESGKGTEVKIDVHLNPTFHVNGNGENEGDVLRIIRTHMKELADEIGGELADRLGEVFSNMPVKA
jgi:TP901 family phage tail tape measure protein